VLLFEAVARGHPPVPETAGRHIYARRHHWSKWQCGDRAASRTPRQAPRRRSGAPAPRAAGRLPAGDWCSLDLTEHDALAELRRVFEGADVVVHLAWGFQPTRDTRYLSRLGVGGTSAVLQAADASSVGQLVHMSSVGTYAAGSYGKRVDESWPTTGIHSSPYSRDKSAAEAILDEYEQRSEVRRFRSPGCAPGSSCSDLRRAG
jgi:nucleoside-diphosphate-sugar epimerase